MQNNVISSGFDALDTMLNGGYEKDIITTIYGPAGSGKTTLCLLCLMKIASSGKKVIFIDTEGGFSVERLKQLSQDYKKIVENILFLKPINFEEQKKSFEKLRKIVNDKIGLIVIDTISMLYRLELGKNEEVYNTNRELGLQLSYLTEIARKKQIPVLITNQVYANFEDKTKINLVGGDILKYGSKCLIELQKAHTNKRKVILRKHRSIADGRGIVFEILGEGLKEIKI